MDFMHILGQKEAIWNTIFSIFERRRAPKRRGARKIPPSTRPSSTGRLKKYKSDCHEILHRCSELRKKKQLAFELKFFLY